MACNNNSKKTFSFQKKRIVFDLDFSKTCYAYGYNDPIIPQIYGCTHSQQVGKRLETPSGKLICQPPAQFTSGSAVKHNTFVC